MNAKDYSKFLIIVHNIKISCKMHPFANLKSAGKLENILIIVLKFLAGPDPIEHATGLEKYELQSAQAGNDVSKSHAIDSN
jgi:hypothetical protein